MPQEWLADIRQADEDTILALADHLPGEAAEALLELATGGKPQAAPPVVGVVDPFEHPDAQRRFRIMTNVTTPDLYPCVLTKQGKSHDPFLKLHKLWLWVTLRHATTSAADFPRGRDPHH